MQDDIEITADEFEAEVIQKIIDLAASINWGFALHSADEDEMLDHIIIGVEGALHEIDKAMDVYDIWLPPKEDNEKDKIIH